MLYSGIGDDQITMSGGVYGVRVLAGPGDDSVATSSGDDFIDPGPGTDDIDGGAGTDTVQFSGKLSEYEVEVVAAADGSLTVTVTDTVPNRGGDYNDGTSVLRCTFGVSVRLGFRYGVG